MRRGFILQDGSDWELPVFDSQYLEKQNYPDFCIGTALYHRSNMGVNVGWEELMQGINAGVLRAGNQLDLTVGKRDFNVAIYNVILLINTQLASLIWEFRI